MREIFMPKPYKSESLYVNHFASIKPIVDTDLC
jgi:hypothetical protein